MIETDYQYDALDDLTRVLDDQTAAALAQQDPDCRAIDGGPHYSVYAEM